MLNCCYLFCCVLLATQIDAKSTKRKGALRTDDDWTGLWFPHAPGVDPTTEVEPHKQSGENECDDGKYLIGIDFAPSDKRDSYHNLCLTANRTTFEPHLQTEPILSEHFIPPAYTPPIKCLNESINYDAKLPTFGSFRPLAPKYGTYKYLPPQRWLHSLARGAIVMLYHPCAFPGQVESLQKILKSCLYRHVISPSQLLSAERPLALLVWGKSLEMSVVDDKIVIRFIKEQALHGPLARINFDKETTFYDTGLLSEAHLITDLQDSGICGYIEM